MTPLANVAHSFVGKHFPGVTHVCQAFHVTVHPNKSEKSFCKTHPRQRKRCVKYKTAYDMGVMYYLSFNSWTLSPVGKGGKLIIHC